MYFRLIQSPPKRCGHDPIAIARINEHIRSVFSIHARHSPARQVVECYLKAVDVKSSYYKSAGVKKIKRPTARTALAYNLRLLRTQRNISQEELAGLAGLHRTFVGSVERGERNVSIDNIEKLAKALKVSVVDLLRTETR